MYLWLNYRNHIRALLNLIYFTMKRILSLAVCFWMLGWGLAVARTPQQPEKSQKVYYNAFSHNDYEHERPLFDALDLGFNCVEADLWLIAGEL